LPNFLNDRDLKLNISTLIIYNSKPYSFFKKISPWYWFIRPMTKYLLNNYSNNKLIGVEIGVEYGLNAKTMLKFLSIEKLFLIDPYKDKLGDECFKQTKIFLRKYSNKIIFIRKSSESAVNDIPNNLDFVYIDGSHEYKFVKKDIELYYDKIKSGGLIGGHDFWADHIGVCKAVLEFANENKLKINGNLTDWWIIKK